jgi:SAM-dependent methyltransferase
MRIAYGTYEDFPGWDGAAAFFGSLIERNGSKSILEIGSGANPTLSPEYVRSQGVRYTTNDVSEGELIKAKSSYETLHLDMAAAERRELPLEAFDLVFSRMVNEHVSDGERYYRNIFSVLQPGGVTAHCFSTLYALPFVINRILPERLGSRVFDAFHLRDRHQHDKFRAHYSWSRGPTRRMIDRLSDIGFEIVEYRGFFGHRYYDRGLPSAMRRLETAKSAWLLDHPVPALTSYATVVLRKPSSS